MSSQNIVMIVVLAVLSIGILSVSLSVSDDDSRIVQVDRSTDDLNLTLKRTACFGTCPVYTLSVFGGGSARFEGLAFTDVEGIAESRLSDDQMSAIASEIVSSDFFEYEQDDQCIVFATDHPSVSLNIRWHGQERHAEMNLGCEKRLPDPIPKLSQRIDEIVDTMQWIGDTEKDWR